MKARPIVFIAFSASITVLTVEGAVAQTENPSSPNWGKYHTTTDAYALLEGWARAYPGLTNLYSIGETLKGPATPSTNPAITMTATFTPAN